MQVHIDQNIQESQVRELADRLRGEEFAAGCFIVPIEPRDSPAEHQIYVKLGGAKHGVILPAGMTGEEISWAIEALRASAITVGAP